MGLFDGYVSGRLPKGITIDSSLEDKLGGEHLTTTEDHNFYLSDYIAAVSKGVELHSELEHVKSIIQYKLNEIKTACETKETYDAALEELTNQNKNTVFGKSIKRSNAHERPWLFKSHTRLHYIDENIVAKELGVNVKNARVVYAGSFSRFDLYQTSSKDLWRAAMDKYIFPQIAEESNDEHSHNVMPQEVISLKTKLYDFSKTLTDTEKRILGNQLQA